MDRPLQSQLARRASLRQLQVFESIARLGSFTRAAEELFLTQPTVSMQIKKLEQAVGLPLFEQVGKKVYLTAAGEALRETAREVLESLAHLEMEVADLQGLKTGQLRLAVVTTAKYFAPRVLGEFSQRYPGIDVALKVTNRERLLERMAGNVDDLYIMGRPPQSTDYAFEPYLANPLVVVAPRSHPLAGRKRISVERISREPFIIREAGSGTRMAMEHLFAEHGLPLNVRMELGSNEAIKQAILGGLGISVLSRHTLNRNSDAGDLAVLDVQGFPIPWQWYVGHAKGKRLSPVARNFLEFLREQRSVAGGPERRPGGGVRRGRTSARIRSA
jgi:DNA-binding transcriptional LysR family regulator